MATVTMRKALAGFYTGTLTGTTSAAPINAVIKRERNGGLWLATFVNCDSGQIIRFAGLWSTYRDARDEIEHIAARDFH